MYLRTIFSIIALLLAFSPLAPYGTSAQQVTGPAVVYFPETGNTLRGGFLNFWRTTGNLPIFGYPITEEFPNPDTGVTTQYFERAVFEWHPNNPAEWRVLLYRLGAKVAAGRDGETAFQPAAPLDEPNCTFFFETEHNLCAGFRSYWETYGALPVFGFPISEEFTEDGRTVQYFERARFEWHPENHGTIYEFLLGHLGVEKAQQLGIDTSAVPQPDGVPVYSPDLWTTPDETEPRPADGFMIDLENDLQAMMAGWGGENSVSVTDLQTGQTISVNGDDVRPASCTIKIPLMMALAQDIDAGLYTHNDIAGLVDETMTPSLVPPARELIAIAGGGSVAEGIHRINGIMQDLGATNSVLAHPPGYPHENYGYDIPYQWHTNLLTSNDTNRMLAALYHGDYLSPSAKDYVLWSLSLGLPHHFESLGGPLPGWVTLYNKIGVIHEPFASWSDAGLVIFESDGQQRGYAITYLGAHGGDYKVHYDRGFAVSEVTWKYFSEAY
jgi:hypothetical protein